MSAEKTVLQVPITKSLRDAATATAADFGFSSLQEALRVFMKKLATREVNITFEDTIRLSPEAEKRYSLMDKDFKEGKNVYEAQNVQELMKQLHEDTLS